MPIGLPRSPLSAFFVEWAGVQNGSYLLADSPRKCDEVLRLMEEQEAPILDAVCELAPPLVHFPDNLSSDCMTGFYDARMAAAHRRRIERLHAAGVRSAVHLDGTVKGLLPKLVRSGFDAIEALTPKPGGDLDVDDNRASRLEFLHDLRHQRRRLALTRVRPEWSELSAGGRSSRRAPSSCCPPTLH